MLVKRRDWTKGCDELGMKFIKVDQEHVYCCRDGFTFKFSRSKFPPEKIQTRHCTDPVEYFKFEIRRIHGDFYNLDETIFNGVDNEVIAECKIHGKFSTSAKHLKTKKGCPRCGRDKSANAKYLGTDEFVRRAKLKHGNTYDYSNVDYVNSETNVEIVCSKHGPYLITPESHIQGQGCRLCGNERIAKSHTKSEDEALSDLINVHGNRYDYSKFKYNGANCKITIGCSIHGDFIQNYTNHRVGKGCPECAKEFNPRFRNGFIKSSIKNNFASLYLLRCFNDDELFYKIGITTKAINVRFASKAQLPYNYDLLHLYNSDGEIVWDLEKILHKEYKEVKYIPRLSFGGMYECFSNIDTNEYKKLLDVIG